MAEDTNVGTVTTDYYNYFTPEFAGRYMEINMLDPELIWDTLLTTFQPTPERSIKKYLYRVNSSGTKITPGRSEHKRRMVLHYPGTKIPTMKAESYAITYEQLKPYANGIHFDADIRVPSDYNRMKVSDTYADHGRWIQEQYNDNIIQGIYGGLDYTVDGNATLATYMDNSSDMSYENSLSFVCGKLDADAYWNSNDADYLKDLTQMKVVGAKQDGYIANFNRMEMDIQRLSEMVLWGQTNGYNWEMSPYGPESLERYGALINGWTVIGLNNIDGMSGNEDKVLFQDSSKKPGITWYYTGAIEPNWTRWGADSKIITASAEEDPDTNGYNVWYQTEINTTINPYSEFYFGELEVY